MARIRMTEARWFVVIAALWAMMASFPAVERQLPASIWFEVRDIHALDARAGQSPLTVVERIVRKPFSARWVAEVERWDGSRFEMVQRCTGRGENNYSPENALPHPPDLTWWVYPADCALEPGQYRIETRWTLSGGQEVRAISNIFTVTN